MNTRITAEPAAEPWWRFGMVWLVFGGPATVVVAALATAVIAFRTADTVVSDPPAAAPVSSVAHSAAPALEARNHAATAGR